MNQTLLTAESTLTERYQTTIPEPIRKVLNLEKREKLRFEIRADGTITISKAEAEDPVVEKFLIFLEKDMESHPKNLSPLTGSFKQKLDNLVGEASVDLNQSLDPDEED